MTDETNSAHGATGPETASGAFEAPVAEGVDLYEPIPVEVPAEPGPEDVPAAGPAPVRKRKRPSLRRVVTVSVIVLALLMLGAYGVMKASSVWGRRAMVTTGVAGIEALIQGRGDELATVSNDAIRAQLTPAVKATMRAKGILAEFGTPVWSRDSAVVTATTGMGPGVFMAVPSDDDENVVVYRTSGTLSYTTGALSFERTWSGWRITGLTVGLTPAASSTVAPSTAPTETP